MTSFLRIAGLSVVLVWSGSAYAAGDASKGETVFNKNCKVCHKIGPGATATIGPAQNGVVGSKAGSRPGFNYSKAMVDAGAGGLTWTEDQLDKYLENPKAVVPNNKMQFPGLKKPDDRADVIAYLATFK